MTDIPIPEENDSVTMVMGLPEGDYHDLKILSNSHICDLLISRQQFWRNWHFPRPRTEPMVIGAAIHCLFLEGQAAFEERFRARSDRPDAPKGVLSTGRDYKEKLTDLRKNHGMAVQFKTNGKELKAHEMKQLLINFRDQHDGPEFDYKFADEHSSDARDILKDSDYQLVQDCVAAAKSHEELNGFLTSGIKEISLFFRSESGILMKARLDLLTPYAYIDLKTIAPVSSNVKQLIAKIKGDRDYGIQNQVYRSAIIRLLQAWERGKLTIIGDLPPGFLDDLSGNKERFHFLEIFLEKHEKCQHVILNSVDLGAEYLKTAQGNIEKALLEFQEWEMRGRPPMTELIKMTASDYDMPVHKLIERQIV